ncbi:MAG TPA: tripartite tricarboxylate transporter substrate-binding protein, partial [Ramlibacter sp.]|nr:tripartite tricarboxylate transporter substrate-binding protein [Ramlibacter sp.]
TLREQGVPVTGTSWSGFAVPAKTPLDVIERLHKSFAKAAGEPAVQERLARLGMAYKPMTTAQFGKFLHEEADTWRRVIEDNKLNVENEGRKK